MTTDNGDVEAQLREALSKAQAENATLAGQFKELALSKYTPAERAKAEKALSDIELQSNLKVEREALKEEAREIYVEKVILANKDVELDRDALLKANSVTEAELIVARAKLAALEAKGAEGADGKKDLSKVKSDAGSGGGTSAGATSPIEGKGRDVVANHFRQIRMERAGRG